MKILVILPGTPVDPQKTGDIQLVQLDTLSQGKQYFVRSELVNNLQTISALENTGAVEITIKSFSKRKHPLHLLKAGLAIKKEIKQNKAEGVYVFWGGMSAWIVTLFSTAPVVLCLLGSDLMGSYDAQGRKTLFGKILVFCSRLACRKAVGIVVMSEKMKSLVNESQQDKVMVLPEGVDLKKFYEKDKAASRTALGWELDKPVVIFFNNGSYVKNAKLAYAAFQLVKAKMPKAELIEVRGVAHSDLINYYNAADLLLFTSFHEGSNNSLKEAMACNCPIVTTDAGDARERLAGVYPSYCVPRFDAGPLAEKMMVILQQPQRSNGRQKMAEVSLENLAIKMSVYLQQLLNKPVAGY